MTLAQWAEIADIKPMPYRGDAGCVHFGDRSYPNRADLWHLEDFVVTCVDGGAIWLAARTTPKH
jgi:hypothetical protein